jgi:hypothetical protein
MTNRRVLFAVAIAVVAVVAILPSANATEISFALRNTKHSGSEPTVGVLPDGTILLQAFGDTLASTDDGATWTVAHTPRTGTFVTADPMLAVDRATGHVVASQLLVASQVISVRDEATGTWTDVVDHAVTGDHQQISSGPWRADSLLPHTYERAYYSCANYVAVTYCSVSRDGGQTWGPNIVAVPGVDPTAKNGVYNVDGLCGGLAARPYVASNGTVYLPRELCGRPVVAVSENEGLTWTVHYVGDAATQTRPLQQSNNPMITSDAAGTMYYAFTGADWVHYVSRSTDGGTTWGTPQNISAPRVRSATFPLVIGGRAGAVATAFVGSENVLPGDDEGTWQGPGEASFNARWHLYVAFSFDADSASPTWTTIKLTPDDDPIWMGCVLRHGTCVDPLISGMADFNGITLTRDGRVAISYTDGCLPGCNSSGQSTSDIAHLAIQTGGPTIG